MPPPPSAVRGNFFNPQLYVQMDIAAAVDFVLQCFASCLAAWLDCCCKHKRMRASAVRSIILALLICYDVRVRSMARASVLVCSDDGKDATLCTALLSSGVRPVRLLPGRSRKRISKL